METEYAIDVLKRRKRELECERDIIHSEIRGGNTENIRKKTRIFHELKSLDFSIEVLETWES